MLALCILGAAAHFPACAQLGADRAQAVEALIRSKQYDEAVQAAQLQLHQRPNDFRLWTLKGIALSLEGSTSKAIAAFDKAILLSPDYPPALKGEVQLLYRSADGRAIPLLERILKNDPKDVTAHEMLATLYRNKGNCVGAVDQFGAIPGTVEKHAASLEADGYCLTQLKRYNEAAPVFEKLAALLPDEAYPKYDLAVVLVTAKQYDAGLKALDPLITANTLDPDVLSLASEANEALGNTPKAVLFLRQAIVLSPSTSDYYVSFAALCLDHDSFQTGIDMMNVGLEHVPDSAAIYLSRGLLHAQLAEYDAAESDFKKAEQLDSTQSLSSYALDLSEMQKNNPERALAQVQSQLKAHPDSPLLNFLLAKLMMNQTSAADSAAFRQAMDSAKRAVKLKPDLVDAHDLLASMYMSSGQYDLAIEQSRIALKYAPADEAATFHLVISLRHVGQKEELPALVRRLSQLHQDSLKKETDRKRYRLELVQAPPPS